MKLKRQKLKTVTFTAILKYLIMRHFEGPVRQDISPSQGQHKTDVWTSVDASKKISVGEIRA
jgi:hypothetical protein